MAELNLGKTQENTPFIIKEFDRYFHMLIVGPTGCGKTSKIIKPGIWQDLVAIKKKRLEYQQMLKEIRQKYNVIIENIKNKDLTQKEKSEKIEAELKRCNDEINNINKYEYIRGLTLIEPKGDLADEVAQLCEELDLPYIYLNPLDPNTDKFNVMEGKADIVAETNRTVLRNIFGKQEQFFALIQETTARNVILLLKKIKGDNLDILDVSRSLRDNNVLKSYVDEYEKKFGTDDLVEYYRSEIFGTLKDKFYQFAMGLRQQLEDLGQNKYLRNILLGKSSINLDKHLAEGGILLVNTAMGALGNLGDTFGRFVIMHFQSAVFRRPGTEFTRPYHHLWIDEVPRYVNPDLERLLAIGRGFRCSVSMALQTPQQLILEEKAALKDIILTNCRNQIIFGGLDKDDAEYFESSFGTDKKRQKQFTYKYNQIAPINLLPKSYRTTQTEKIRFRYTDIMELPTSRENADVLIKYVRYGELQKPVRVTTRLWEYHKPDEIIELEDKMAKDTTKNKQKRKEKRITKKIKSFSLNLKIKTDNPRPPEPEDVENHDHSFGKLLNRIKTNIKGESQPEQPQKTIQQQEELNAKTPINEPQISKTYIDTTSETNKSAAIVHQTYEFVETKIEEVNNIPSPTPGTPINKGEIERNKEINSVATDNNLGNEENKPKKEQPKSPYTLKQKSPDSSANTNKITPKNTTVDTNVEVEEESKIINNPTPEKKDDSLWWG